MTLLSHILIHKRAHDDDPIDWISNPWGWPSVFGLGDDAARHPIDPDHDMIWLKPNPNWVAVWDERLQLEYGIVVS